MFKIVGGIIGFFMGSFLGLFGMIIGAVVGSNVGRSVDSLLFGTTNRSRNNQNTEDAYRRFYEQFNQNSRSYNTGYSGDFNNFQTGATDKCYSDIGCNRADSNDHIKKTYRKLVSQYHPDRLASKGLSDSDQAAAENRFKVMQESYNHIKKEKGI
ncbi:MAG: DnaJ domain-containing protein [Spirochaetaceae bacterium]